MKMNQKNMGTGNAIKDPEDWTTGDEPMTGAQLSYLNTLATAAGEDLPSDLTKAEASKEIDNLLKTNQQNVGTGNAVKDPEDWTTGYQPMTGAQSSYLNTLATEAGEEVPNDLSKAEASKEIEKLQKKTGRGMFNHDE